MTSRSFGARRDPVRRTHAWCATRRKAVIFLLSTRARARDRKPEYSPYVDTYAATGKCCREIQSAIGKISRGVPIGNFWNYGKCQGGSKPYRARTLGYSPGLE